MKLRRQVKVLTGNGQELNSGLQAAPCSRYFCGLFLTLLFQRVVVGWKKQGKRGGPVRKIPASEPVTGAPNCLAALRAWYKSNCAPSTCWMACASVVHGPTTRVSLTDFPNCLLAQNWRQILSAQTL